VSTHTPGPWTVTEHTNFKGEFTPVGSVRSQDWFVAKIEDAPEALANAHLIAAAPELLAALREMIVQGEWKPGALPRALAAIDKAEGK